MNSTGYLPVFSIHTKVVVLVMPLILGMAGLPPSTSIPARCWAGV